MTSNVSSLPEVAGDAAVLINPYDPEAIAEGIYQVLTDEQLRRGLRQRGLAQARQFSWEGSARRVRAVYQQVGEAPAGAAAIPRGILKIALVQQWLRLRGGEKASKCYARAFTMQRSSPRHLRVGVSGNRAPRIHLRSPALTSSNFSIVTTCPSSAAANIRSRSFDLVLSSPLLRKSVFARGAANRYCLTHAIRMDHSTPLRPGTARRAGSLRCGRHGGLAPGCDTPTATLCRYSNPVAQDPTIHNRTGDNCVSPRYLFYHRTARPLRIRARGSDLSPINDRSGREGEARRVR